MKSLLIIGAGGHGKVVKEIAEDLDYEKIDFIDDNNPEAIGKIEELNKFLRYKEAIVVIGKCAHINAGAIVKAGGFVENYRKLQAGEVVIGY